MTAALALVPLGAARTAEPEQPASSPVFSAAAPGAQRAPAIAWNGSNYLVVWEDDRGSTWDVYAARVSAARNPNRNPYRSGNALYRCRSYVPDEKDRFMLQGHWMPSTMQPDRSSWPGRTTKRRFV